MNQFSKANIIGYSGTLIKCELARVFLSVREVCFSLPHPPLFAMFPCVTCYYAPFPSVSRSHLTDWLPWRNCFKISMEEHVCKMNVSLPNNMLLCARVRLQRYIYVLYQCRSFPPPSHCGPTFSHGSCRLDVRGT